MQCYLVTDITGVLQVVVGSSVIQGGGALPLAVGTKAQMENIRQTRGTLSRQDNTTFYMGYVNECVECSGFYAALAQWIQRHVPESLQVAYAVRRG